MIDGVFLVAEAIRAEQKAAAEAAGKTEKTVNVEKSPEDPVTAITGGKKKTKKTEPEPQTEPEPKTEPEGDDDKPEGDDDKKEE